MAACASAAARMADALLRTLGGTTATLHVPSPAVPDDLGEQVGLVAPAFQDVTLGPVAVRRVLVGRGAKTTAATCELLVSATAVERLLGSLAFNSAAILFASAASVEVGGTTYRIVSAVSTEAFGAVYLYRLGLAGASAAAV